MHVMVFSLQKLHLDPIRIVDRKVRRFWSILNDFRGHKSQSQRGFPQFLQRLPPAEKLRVKAWAETVGVPSK